MRENKPVGKTLLIKTTALLKQVGQRCIETKCSDKKSGVWFGLALMGVIGWSIASYPVGCGLGIWIDKKLLHERRGLSLLLAGLALVVYRFGRGS